MAEKEPFGFGATFWLPLSRDQFTALGIIATTFGQIEAYVDRMVLHLSGLRSPADLEVFYDGRQFGAKVNMLRRLSVNADDSAKAPITEACKHLDTLAATRNQALHGLWGKMNHPGAEGHGETLAYSPRAPNKFLRSEGLSSVVADVEKGATAVHAAMVSLFPEAASQKLPWHHRFEPDGPPPSPPKGPEAPEKPIEFRGRKT